MDCNDIVNILKDCYRKFKSYISFSSNLEYVKKCIYQFEDDRMQMDNKFKEIAENLLKENLIYFENLCKKIRIIPAIKSIRDDDKNPHLVTNKYDGKKEIVITKLNFFAELPIELFILDTYWSIIIGTFINDENIKSGCKANIFTDKLYKYGTDIVSSINFKNLALFKPYYPQYLKWKNEAIEKAKSLHANKNDLSIFSIDISRYFYNADIDFSIIHKKFIAIEPSYDSFAFLELIIAKIYEYGNIELHKIYTTTSNKNTLLLGLVSSTILGNYYLNEVDNIFRKDKCIKYYGRYVDDILIVIDKVDFDSAESLFSKYLSKEIVCNKNSFCFKGYDDLKIQAEKTTIIKIYNDQSDAILKKLSKELHPSEPRLFPSYGQNMKEFLSNLNSEDEIIKFRDAKTAKVDVKKLITAINCYLSLHTNTRVPRGMRKKEFKKPIIDELMLLLTPKALLSLYQRWNKIYLFAWLNKNGNASLITKLKANIKKGISSLTLELEDGTYCDKKTLKKSVKAYLKYLFELAIESALAITGNSRKNENEGKTYFLDIASKLRKSNLIDYNALAMPIVNLLPDSSLGMSVNLFYLSLLKRKKLSECVLDDNKVKYSPRFIHLCDYLFFASYKGFNSTEYSIAYEKELNSYKSYVNGAFGDVDIPLKVQSYASKKDTYKSFVFNFNDFSFYKDNSENIRIGLANINLENIYKNMISKRGKIFQKSFYTASEKLMFRKLLNSCFIENPRNDDYIYPNKDNTDNKVKKSSKEPVSYLVFPEVYLPYEWLPDLLKYCKDTGTIAITGLRYVVDSKRVYNLQAVVIPYKNKDFYKQVALFIREKNNYAPFEKEIIVKSGMEFFDHINPIYYQFKFHKTTFSTFICYEMTDIFARALIRKDAELVFASEYNYDIAYFSNIAESASRDLSCFVVQVNSSTAGDTRIVAPYRDKFKNLANIKGGIRDSVHIGSVNLKELREYLKSYKIADDMCCYESLSKNGKFSKMKKPSAGSKK